MTFREIINYELYGNKKLSIKDKFLIKYIIPETNARFLLRKYLYLCEKGKRIRARFVYKKLVTRYNIFVGKNTKIGIGLNMPHPSNIVIGKDVVIGENCTIYQGVTIGAARVGDSKIGKYPIIKNDCVLFAGASVLGDIVLEKGTKVGAGAVLLTDTEENGVYVGVPARKI